MKITVLGGGMDVMQQPWKWQKRVMRWCYGARIPMH